GVLPSAFRPRHTRSSHAPLLSKPWMRRSFWSHATPNLRLLRSSPSCRSARKPLVSVTRFSFCTFRRPPAQVQPRFGSFRSSVVFQVGVSPALVYCRVVNGELTRMVGDSRNIQLRLVLACTSSLTFWSSPNQKVAPGLICQYCTSSMYSRCSRKNWAL